MDNYEELIDLNFLYILKIGLLNFVAYSFLSIVVIFLVCKISPKKILIILSSLIKFLLIFLSLCFCFFPVYSGLILQESLVFLYSNFLFSFLLSTLFLFLGYKKIINHFILIALIISGHLLVGTYSFLKNYKSFNYEFYTNEYLPFSRNNSNIIYLSFDAIQGDIFKSKIKKLSDEFNGFKYYENTIPAAPYTYTSLKATKHSSLNDYKKIPLPQSATSLFDFMEFNIDKYFNNYKLLPLPQSITSLFHDNGFNVETFDYTNIGESPTTNKLSDKKNHYIKLMKLVKYRYDPFNISNFVILNFNVINNLIYVTSSKHYTGNILKDQILNFDDFINKIHVEGDKKTFRFHHYAFTHDPVLFEKDCQYNLSIKSRSRLEYQDKEAECLAQKIHSVVMKLKQKNIFDSSTIIFSSDHGRECLYDSMDNPVYFHVSDIECNNRYKSFLMFKFPNSGNKPLVFSKENVSLLDITPTLCNYFLDGYKCEQYDGIDLRNPDYTKDFDILIYNNKGAGNDGKTPRHITRGLSYDDQLSNFPFNVSLNSSSKGLEFKSNSYFIDPFLYLPFSTQGLRSYGPQLKLVKGRYKLKIIYTKYFSNNLNSFFDVMLDGKIIYKENFSNENESEYKFSCTKKICNNLEIRTFYNDNVPLKISNIQLLKLDNDQ